jgi:peptidoglycan/xylan/chitin deacetylase (PgdA/CDA1 family)
MTSTLTIVMYHYVRNAEASAHPGIHALSIDNFVAQLDYLSQHHSLISPQELLDAIRDNTELPANAVLLTFDDGYVDHTRTVAPILNTRGIKAAFFPAATPVTQQTVLSANKLQFVRAQIGDANLVAQVFRRIEAYRSEYGLDTLDSYRARWHEQGRLDSNEMRLVKNLLQKGFPLTVRRLIIDELFETHVTKDEAGFSKALYATESELRDLIESGHHVGNHGYQHEWLDHMQPEDAATDIRHGAEFLQSLGVPSEGWIMCYPYGGHNDTVSAAARRAGAAAGFVVDFTEADLARHNAMTLPRLDTNQIPPLAAKTRAQQAKRI